MENNLDREDLCYSTAFWSPFLLPFTAKYNGVGGGTNSSTNIKCTLQALRDRLVEMPQGPNEYHDVEVTAAKLDEDLFYNAVHEQRLFISDWQSRKVAVNFSMIKSSAVDYLCANWVISDYVGAGLGTRGDDNEYVEWTWAAIEEEVSKLFDTVLRWYNTGLWRGADTHWLSAYLNGREAPGLVTRLLHLAGDYDYSRLANPLRIVEAVGRESRSVAHTLVLDAVRAAYIASFMGSTRKLWTPGGNEGSTTYDFYPYRILIGAMTNELNQMQDRLED